MFCINFIFIIFLFNAQQLSGSNKTKNVTVELLEDGPLKIKFKFVGNCTSFTMCYKSVLYEKNVPWKLSKRFRFDKFFCKILTNTNECGQNGGRKIEFSIVNGTVFVGKNETFKFNKKYSSQVIKTFSKFELHLNRFFFGNTLVINKVKLETMNIGNEFLAHSSLGTFLADYAGLWLLAADIAPKKGQNPTKLMINVPDKCSIIYKIPPKCHTFDMEAAENGTKRSAKHINPLISGGHSMDIKRMPWTVYFAGRTALNETTNIGHYSTCTASLISEKFILLAAHCLKDVEEGNPIRLGLNSSLRNIFNKTNYDGILVKLERKNDSNVFIHPKYMPPYVYDLALIKLPKDAIKFTSKMQPICIHCGSAAKFRTGIGHIAGWGRLLDNDCYAEKDAVIPMDLMGRTAHLIACPDLAFKSDLICMEGSTIQSGDSGSPLLANNGTHFVQVGVTSSSICNRKINTSLYNIFSRLDGRWIENIAGVRCGK